jgi:starch-binding outer membrane protein, SusD/RagB family
MKINILFIAGFLVGLSACHKDLLEPIPQTAISDAVAFSTPEKALAEVQGMYAGIKGKLVVGTAVQTGFWSGRFPVYQEIRGENFVNETNNGVTNLNTWNYSVNPSTNEVQNAWYIGYNSINRINIVIAGVQTSPISEELKTQYVAEGRFLRGLAYFSLVTLYGRPYWDGNGDKAGLVLYTEPQTASGNNLKPRSKVSEVYNQILDDLNFAETNLPLTYTGTMAVTRAHRNAAIALKTRVYLNMRRYADVITEANKIVSAAAPFKATTGVPHELQSNIANLFGAGGMTTENIFSFVFTSQDLPGTQNSLNQYYSPSPGGNGDYSLNTASGVVSNTSWTAADARRSFNQVTGGKTWLRKWTANTDAVPVIRYSEVLLNLAEALARTNGVDARAIELLNAVRKRSDPAVTLAPATQQALVDAILLERNIELLGEGLRAMDLMRLGIAFPAKPGVQAVNPTDPQYIWPIPISELVVNVGLEQNTGY